MSYPPPGGYPPYPPAHGSTPEIGFGSAGPPRPAEGHGYPLSPPQPGGTFPPSSGYPPQQTYSQPPTNYSSPSAPSYAQPGAPGYPPQGGPSPYPPLSGNSGPSPYPPAGSSPYPPAGGSSAYPPPGGSSPYPPTGGSSGYPPPAGSSPYPPAGGSSPYPPPGGSSAYPPPGGSSPYAPPGGASAYPPAGGSSPYPPPGGGFPVPPSGSQNPYPPPGGSSYPPSTPYGQQPMTHSKPPGGSAYGRSLQPYQQRPTVRPGTSFDPSTDASHLRKAMKGLGTDEKAIIHVLARRTSDQRQQIMLKYQQAYGRDLVKDLKSELSGQFEDAILALMTPLPVFLAKALNSSIVGIGTKERVLIEILCTRDNNSIRAIKAAYYNLYHAQLDQHIRDDTSGNFKRILVSMSTGQRDEHNTDTSVAPGLAQSLYKAGEGKWGTEESEFRRILSTYSYPVLRCVFEEYRKIRGSSFEEAIKSELSGDFRDAMLAIYHSILNQAAFFASQLRNAMKGIGTKDSTLIRIVISRCEIDMGNIKDEYKKAYGKRLEDAISSETSGDYKKVLLALVQD